MKQLFKILCFILLIILLCYNSSLVIDGALKGLYLWYNSLIPVVLPFLLLQGLFMSSINIECLSTPMSIFVLLVCGCFCGYPIGAITAGKLYNKGAISYKTASALLPLCNNISPMFLYGFIFKNYIPVQYSFYKIILIIYIPQIIYAILFIVSGYSTAGNALKSDSTTKIYNNADTKSIISTSVNTITIIGVYIVIFSILDCIITHLFPDNQYIFLFSSFLEITKGVNTIYNLPIMIKIKTALILSLTSFGGISAIFQSIHLLKESKLSLISYISGKLICSITTFWFAYKVML